MSIGMSNGSFGCENQPWRPLFAVAFNSGISCSSSLDKECRADRHPIRSQIASHFGDQDGQFLNLGSTHVCHGSPAGNTLSKQNRMTFDAAVHS